MSTAGAKVGLPGAAGAGTRQQVNVSRSALRKWTRDGRRARGLETPGEGVVRQSGSAEGYGGQAGLGPTMYLPRAAKSFAAHPVEVSLWEERVPCSSGLGPRASVM